ncbi:pyridoxal phosphate-dependent decarboxylase family protein [Stigmatella aurantiaca]|uniref:Sphingosine-1-phosphate lyase 1 n=1 Tax=Stigmatella aurantiaca (strain DW4/3-1) TaxID=378806 RepID=Q08TY4_STIAD|nr:aspartate aminotransferase family protein [Stigmatella aurantiaca]ADO69940.1 Sphingosine-1-phosphate lyase 1 [Stigmatella aurantiaca DW4/3-1]EAU63938.1 sphingosine-1-phosphate lyase 1 [Stigmatella aurantiaca DW4/3-1]
MTSKSLPKNKRSKEEVLAELRTLRAEDARWKEGRTFSLVYHVDDEHSALLKEAYGEFISENGLSPLAFPSLRRMESDVISMAAELFHGNEDVAGTMTTGGTESIMMAVKAARQWAREEKGIGRPEMIVPLSVHPAFEKAAHYFDVDIQHAALGADFRVDVREVERLITPRTALIVGSAPPYPQGVLDPISELAALAQARGLLCHVDACLGGFFLPFARKLGRDIPPFDFEVPGVTSLSADLHKYGYAAKGASVVLYRNRALRRHQFFTYGGWPGGLYASPSMTGTRPGGAIAAAWAVMQALGEEGYLENARRVLSATDTLVAGINAIPGLRVLGAPQVGVFAFSSDSLNVYELGDAMEARGWKMDRQQNPPALHCMITPSHERIVEPLLADLRDCASKLAAGEPAPEGSAAMYGMVGAIPDSKQVDGFLLEFLDGVFDRT